MRRLTAEVWVSPQIAPGQLQAAADAGLRRVINNRPDGEEPGQPTSEEVQAAAHASGLDYMWIPVRGLPDEGAVEQTRAALSDGAPTLLYCRSGMRSAAAWAMACCAQGADAAEVRAAAAGAGYDLSRLPL